MAAVNVQPTSIEKRLDRINRSLLALQKKSEEHQKKVLRSGRWTIENQTLELRKLRAEFKQNLDAIRSEIAVFGDHEGRISRLEAKKR